MNMEDILNSGANVTLTIKSTDLKEFAEHLVKKTVRSIRDSFIRPEEDYLTIKEASQILHTDKSTLWRWHKIGYLCSGKSSVSCPLKPSDSAPLC